MQISSAPPLRENGVTQLMAVGNYEADLGMGMGAFGPDIGATARTVGWAAAAVWAYANFVKKDKALAKKTLPFAIGGWAASFLL